MHIRQVQKLMKYHDKTNSTAAQKSCLSCILTRLIHSEYGQNHYKMQLILLYPLKGKWIFLSNYTNISYTSYACLKIYTSTNFKLIFYKISLHGKEFDFREAKFAIISIYKLIPFTMSSMLNKLVLAF